MKIKVLLILVYISSFLYTNVELLINNYHPYQGEVTSIILSGSINGDNNSYSLGIPESDYTIVKDMEVITEGKIKFMLKVVFNTPGEKKLIPELNDFIGDSKTLIVEPIDYQGTVPTAKVLLSKEWAFAGELVLYKIDLFSDNFIGDVDFHHPKMDNQKIVLEPGVNKNIYYSDGSVGKVKRVISYGLYNSNQGVFQVPTGNLTYRNREVTVPPVEFEVFKLPKEVKSHYLIGEHGKIFISELNDRYHYNSKIEFTIKVYGNLNLYNLDSLKPYSSNLSNFKESLISYESKVIHDFIYQEKVFSYSGIATNLTGITTPTISIPLFNTETYEIEHLVVDSHKTKGSFNLFFLILTLLIVLSLISYMILITVKWIKNSYKQDKVDIETYFIEYDLSNRERDILQLLIPGKSNKEIASELNISPETVKKHIQNILKKSCKSSRIELIAEISPKL